MKRLFVNMILACAGLLLMGSCNEFVLEMPEQGKEVDSGDGLITLYLMNGGAPTRAATDLMDYEKAVSHIDIIMFEDDGTGKMPGKWAFHARKEAVTEGQKIVLGRKSEFGYGKKYWIYVIANHVNNEDVKDSEGKYVSDSSAEFDEAKCGTFEEFCKKISQHERVFLTGHEDLWSSAVTIPKYFLMDGLAYNSADATKTQTCIVLNDLDPNNTGGTNVITDLHLQADLKRAAAKIKVNIQEGAHTGTEAYVDFKAMGKNDSAPDAENTNSTDYLALDGFYFRELPYQTSLIGDSRYVEASKNFASEFKPQERRNTVKYNGTRFDNTTDPNKVIITTYAYSRNWSGAQAIDNTTIVVNLPLDYYEYGTWNGKYDAGGNELEWQQGQTDDTGKTVVAETKDGVATGKYLGWSKEPLPANYYQIPISKDKSLVRNGYYEVTVEINIPGGSDPGEPVALSSVNYVVEDWKPVSVGVGASSDKPAYLAVNKNELEIHNVSHDYTSLEFTSSKDVEVDIVDYWYYDKDGVKVTYSEDPDEFSAGKLLGTRIVTTYTPSTISGTYSQAVSTLEALDSDDSGETLAKKYARFSGTDTYSWTTYEELGPNDKGDEYNFTRQTKNTIINYLVATYGLTTNDATELFNEQKSELTETSESSGFPFYQTTYYYSGKIVVPLKKVEHSVKLVLDGKSYNDIKAMLPGISDADFESFISNKTVTGTAQVPKSSLQDTYSKAITIDVNASGMSGNIKIDSSLPENNTVRYIEVRIRNDYKGTPNNINDDLSETIIIKQYPLLYITNMISYYSYRDDFIEQGQTAPTTYENYSSNSRITGISYNGGSYAYYPARTNTNSNYTSSEGSLFFRSKVFENPSSTGNSTIRYYTISNGSISTSRPPNNSSQNPRMYHVRMTSSSNEYTLGAPRLDVNGYTDDGDDNANMVSPSFMIASRLGFFNTGFADIDNAMSNEATGLPLVREHCKQYVEVYEERDENGNKTGNKYTLNDWRLPTTAELKIIMNLQGRSSTQDADAIDYLLNAGYYYSASGRVYNMKQSSTGSTSVRCIRDAFDTK